MEHKDTGLIGNIDHMFNNLKARLLQIEIEKSILEDEIILIKESWKELEAMESEIELYRLKSDIEFNRLKNETNTKRS